MTSTNNMDNIDHDSDYESYHDKFYDEPRLSQSVEESVLENASFITQ